MQIPRNSICKFIGILLQIFWKNYCKKTYINENGEHVTPTEPNGYKFELLVLDMIHMMDNNLAYEVARENEFAPIKNLHGVDSVDSARELLKLNGVRL